MKEERYAEDKNNDAAMADGTRRKVPQVTATDRRQTGGEVVTLNHASN